MSSRIFEKMAEQKLSAFRETTANHRFYGSRRLRMMQKREEKRRSLVEFIIISNKYTKAIYTTRV